MSDRHFIATIEMTMRCSGVVGEEVGVKCGGIQGCCAGGRPGVRCYRSRVQVAASTKTKTESPRARLEEGSSACRCPKNMEQFGGKNPPARFFWKRGGGGGLAELRERRGMNIGVGEKYPPTEPQGKRHGRHTTGKQPGC